MTRLDIQRRASSHVNRNIATKVYENNPARLRTQSSSVTLLRSFLSWTIPPLVLDKDTHIAAAYITFMPINQPAGVGFRLGRVLGKIDFGRTLSWNRQPASADHVIATTDANTVRIRDGVHVHRLEFDVLEHLLAMQDGAANHGWSLEAVNASSASREVGNNGTSVAVLTIVYYQRPKKPVDLSPAGDDAVSTPEPTLSAMDVNPGATLVSGFEVELYDNNELVWSSGMVDTSEPILRLADADGVPAQAEGTTRGWRCRVRGVGNQIGPWSDIALYRYVPFGAAAFLSPADGGSVTDPTPVLLWETAFAQRAYRLKIVDPLRPPTSPPLWDSGVVSTSEKTATPPVPVATEPGAVRRAVLWVWDEENRSTASASHVEATVDFTLSLSAGVPAADGFEVVDLAPLPFVKGVWSRENIPDEWQWVRDGVVVATIPGPDLLVNGSATEYEYIDHFATPRREHTWAVRASENGATSAANATVTKTIEPGGIWLCDPEAGIYLPFITDTEQQFTLSEAGGTHYPLHGRFGVRITSTLRGYEGQITAELLATSLSGPMTGADLRDAFLEVRERSGRRLVLTVGDFCWPVIAYDMSVAPTRHAGRNGDYLYAAQFRFFEVP